MNSRTRFLIELLDKLGSPLMTAAIERGGDDLSQAKTVAALVGSSVQLGMSLGQMVGVNDSGGSEDEADSLRVTLAALSGPLVADAYKGMGRAPSAEDTQKMSKSFESIIAFAQNFSPAAGHAARLKSLSPEKPVFDASQSQIFYLSVMTPVVAAIAEFSYGTPENSLVQDIAGKLEARANALRADLIGSGADEAEVKFAELMILHTLARIYAACHRAETARILSTPDMNGAPSLDPVWKAFDVRVSMLETLLNIAVPAGQAAQAPRPPVAATPPPPAAPEAQTSGNPLSFFGKKADEPTQTPAPAPPPAAGGSPMSFFKPGAKKAGEDENGA